MADLDQQVDTIRRIPAKSPDKSAKDIEDERRVRSFDCPLAITRS
jgi:hypothetical protein